MAGRDFSLNATCIIEDLVGDTLNSHWQSHRNTNLASTVIQFGILISGMLLNGFTFAVLIRIISRRPFYLLLLNLVALDFCTSAISVCFNVLVGSFGIHNIGNSDYIRCQLCKFSSFLFFFKFISLLNLSLMSMDRFICFVLLAKYKEMNTIFTTGFSILCTWVIGISYLIPLLRGYGDTLFLIPCGYVFITKQHLERSAQFLISIGLVMLIVTIIAVTTTVMIWTKTLLLLKTNNCATVPESEGHSKSDITDKTDSLRPLRIMIRKQIQLYSIFGAIAFVDTLTYLIALPLFGSLMLALHHQVIDTALIFILLQTILHPLVIAFLEPDLYAILLKCGWSQNRSLKRLKLKKAIKNVEEGIEGGDSTDKDKKEARASDWRKKEDNKGRDENIWREDSMSSSSFCSTFSAEKRKRAKEDGNHNAKERQDNAGKENQEDGNKPITDEDKKQVRVNVKNGRRKEEDDESGDISSAETKSKRRKKRRVMDGDDSAKEKQEENNNTRKEDQEDGNKPITDEDKKQVRVDVKNGTRKEDNDESDQDITLSFSSAETRSKRKRKRRVMDGDDSAKEKQEENNNTRKEEGGDKSIDKDKKEARASDWRKKEDNKGRDENIWHEDSMSSSSFCSTFSAEKRKRAKDANHNAKERREENAGKKGDENKPITDEDTKQVRVEVDNERRNAEDNDESEDITLSFCSAETKSKRRKKRRVMYGDDSAKEKQEENNSTRKEDQEDRNKPITDEDKKQVRVNVKNGTRKEDNDESDQDITLSFSSAETRSKRKKKRRVMDGDDSAKEKQEENDNTRKEEGGNKSIDEGKKQARVRREEDNKGSNDFDDLASSASSFCSTFSAEERKMKRRGKDGDGSTKKRRKDDNNAGTQKQAAGAPTVRKKEEKERGDNNNAGTENDEKNKEDSRATESDGWKEIELHTVSGAENADNQSWVIDEEKEQSGCRNTCNCFEDRWVAALIREYNSNNVT